MPALEEKQKYSFLIAKRSKFTFPEQRGFVILPSVTPRHTHLNICVLLIVTSVQVPISKGYSVSVFSVSYRRLKERCGTSPPIYRLIENMHNEAILVDYTCKLVSSQSATTTRRKKPVEKQAHLQKLWDEYM